VALLASVPVLTILFVSQPVRLIPAAAGSAVVYLATQLRRWLAGRLDGGSLPTHMSDPESAALHLITGSDDASTEDPAR
jgi:hypothetical protein